MPTFNIVVSALLLPVNLVCSFWLLREALFTAGMVPAEFFFDPVLRKKLQRYSSDSHHSKMMRQQTIRAYLTERSDDPARTKRLFHWYMIATLPGIFALPLAFFGVVFPSGQRWFFFLNLAVLLLNGLLWAGGRLYGRRHPMDALTAEHLEEKRRQFRPLWKKHLPGICLGAAFFLGVLLVIPLGAGGALSAPSGEALPVEELTQEQFKAALESHGFVTENIPVTYWQVQEEALMYTAAGERDNTKLEFYDYYRETDMTAVFEEIASRLGGEGAAVSAPEESRREYTLETERALLLRKGHCIVLARYPAGEDLAETILRELGL